MNKSMFAIATTLLLCTPPMASTPVEASGALLRCKSPDGSMVYTDKACSAFGAKAAPMPGELLGRIARDESREQSLLENTYASAVARWDDTKQGLAASRRRDPALGCARTPTQLAMDLGSAVAAGDVNRIAESYHWAGMSTRAGERIMDRLQHLTGRQVVDSHYFDAQIGFADADTWTTDASSGTRGGDAGMLQVTLDDQGSRTAVDFDVHEYSGCYFVSF